MKTTILTLALVGLFASSYGQNRRGNFLFVNFGGNENNVQSNTAPNRNIQQRQQRVQQNFFANGNEFNASIPDNLGNPTNIDNNDFFAQIDNLNNDIQVQSVQIVAVTQVSNPQAVRNNISNTNKVNNIAFNVRQVQNDEQQQVQVKQRQVRDKEDKDRNFRLNLGRLELPKPQPLGLGKTRDKEEKIKEAKPLVAKELAATTKTTKASGSGLYVQKHFFKRKIINPIKGWFKRHFPKRKKFKVRLTCPF